MHIDTNVTDKVTTLLSKDYREWEVFFRQHPELRSDVAEEWLGLALQNVPPGMPAVRVAKVHDAFSLVKRCMDLGIDAALAEFNLKLSKPAYFADTLRKLDFPIKIASQVDQRVKDLKLALSCLDTRDDEILRARLQSNLAAYLLEAQRSGSSGGSSKDVEDAIDTAQDAADVFTEKKYPERWAELQATIATALVMLENGNIVNNLDKALQYYDQALKIITKKTHPDRWVSLMNSRSLAKQMRDSVGAD